MRRRSGWRACAATGVEAQPARRRRPRQLRGRPLAGRLRLRRREHLGGQQRQQQPDQARRQGRKLLTIGVQARPPAPPSTRVLGGQQQGAQRRESARQGRQDPRRLSAGDGPSALAFDGENVWVANFFSGDVMKLRAEDGERLGARAWPRRLGIAFDWAQHWVAASGTNSVTAPRTRLGDGDLRHRPAPAAGALRRRQPVARQFGERLGVLHRARLEMKRPGTSCARSSPRWRASRSSSTCSISAGGVHDAGVRPRAAEQQPGDAPRPASRHRCGAAHHVRHRLRAHAAAAPRRYACRERLSPPVDAVVAAAARSGLQPRSTARRGGAGARSRPTA